MAIIVHVEELEKRQEVLDALRPLGIDLHEEETTEGQTRNFFLGRINSKLDNLGQLKHLYKLPLHLKDIAATLASLDRREHIDEQLRREYAERFANDWGIPKRALHYGECGKLTFDEIERLLKLREMDFAQSEQEKEGAQRALTNG